MISDEELVLPDYGDIWFTNCSARYRALKGGRSTGKTYQFIGLEPIFKILTDNRRNIMFARQNYKDNATSTFNQVKSCIRKLGLMHLFKFATFPHKITRIATGQVIVFGGMNDVENMTSTAFEVGYWTDLYFEEASQLKSYDEFRVVDGSMRIPNTEKNLKVQITFLFNAWDIGHWLYDAFFKGRLEDDVKELEEKGYQFYYDKKFNLGQDSSGLALHISSYKCNLYNSEDKINNMLELKNIAYNLYLVEGLGCWGNTTGVVYDCWSDSLITPRHVINNMQITKFAIGIDTAYSDGQGRPIRKEGYEVGSAMVMELVCIAGNNKLIFVDEYFHTNIGARIKKTSVDYQQDIIDTLFKWKEIYPFMKMGINVYIDCADIGFRQAIDDTARKRGLYNVRFIGSTKLPIHNRIVVENHLMAYGEFLVSEACSNLIREIKSCRQGTKGEPRADTNDHAINASEYGWAPIGYYLMRWKNIKLL